MEGKCIRKCINGKKVYKKVYEWKESVRKCINGKKVYKKVYKWKESV